MKCVKNGYNSYFPDDNPFQIQTKIETDVIDELFCLILLDDLVQFAPCSSVSPSDETSTWAWQGPSSLKHISSGLCLAANSLSHGAR